MSGTRWIEGPGTEGDPAAVRAAVDAYREAGVDPLILDFAERELGGVLRQLRTFAEQVGVGSAT
ncbi:hypothetical protein [Pseudofrankia sp. BMG5.37]|uniref:hypothetical protein n=1 Tax=Pseudofrankia sp. BMG5.37 TaxID=3050035 RepID=UPI002893EC47|nr:hypothetical protein [Pseudofrankia sp. BMG5.37]MDT3444922.1 hypothetical protein [Pseudofrankia sp. BMG5.37]